ncbi:glycosyltransferase family 2 protein [Paenibacillus senegalensis]|uniref:glycosyltransferase family 2 protein n=1 Tax=Paenibacillus senegalensis TaxID=1465766 RepID=UPI0002880ABC|nr:glycosyltransferase family 2 protein [Paenibacillus senegalensis]
MKTVSVHVVTYNSAEDIEACLDGILKQTYPISQIIIVDNASKDDTISRLRPYQDQLEIIANAQNIGFAPAHNQAIRRSHCDYCLVLNPDVSLHPDYVAELIDFAENNERAGSLTGKLVLKQAPEQIDTTGLTINKDRRAFDQGRGQAARDWVKAEEVFGVSGAAALYRKTMVDEISVEGEFFDESFFAYKEDVDVAWRARLMGWDAYFVPSAPALHERGWKESSRSQQPLMIRQFSYINRIKMMIKNDSGRYFWLHSPFILSFDLAGIVYMLLKEPKVLLAWKRIFKEWSELCRKRKIIQQKRKRNYAEIYKWFQ